MLKSSTRLLCLLALFGGSPFMASAASSKSVSIPAIAAAKRMNVVENDPQNPKGMQIRRARQKGELWPEYFREVYLWPYSSEHFNRMFTTLNQNGRKIQFIADTTFAAEGKWYVVLRGDQATVELMSQNIVLENGSGTVRLEPVGTRILPSLTDDTWIGCVAFAAAKEPVKQIMSSFALYARAGGVADVLDEDAARRRYAVLRDLVEFIERIHQEELRQGR
jgi:hypothetical protein